MSERVRLMSEADLAGVEAELERIAVADKVGEYSDPQPWDTALVIRLVATVRHWQRKAAR